MSKPKPNLSYIAEHLRKMAVPIDSLQLDPDNARRHDDANRASIRASLVERGQVLPITVRLFNRRVMTGNGTLEEARALGWTHIAAILLDYDEAQAAAWAIAHNRSAELATWDFEQLAATMVEFDSVDWGAVGWEASELEAIIAQARVEAASPTPETTTVAEHEREIGGEHDSEDEVPALPAEPRTKAGEVVELGPHVLHCCDCMDLLRSLPDNSIDAIVTDPPYGLSPDGRARTWDDIEALRREGKGPTGGFMGNAWDAGVPGVTWARECLRVLKPGGHMIAHSATRTVHRLACAIEDAGFEIRDQIGWLHWQGFPKSHDVSKAIDEMHGAERTVEVDRRRVPDASLTRPHFAGIAGNIEYAPATDDAKRWNGWGTALKPACEPAVLARKPISESTVAANVLRWGTGAINIDACRFTAGDKAWPGPGDDTKFPANIYACPKPASAEREAGTEHCGTEHCGKVSTNTHPTVKPTKLYRWLLRLVTPPGGLVLEPFGGSGTTLVAATKEGFRVIAAEREPKYCDIIRARVEHALLP